MSPEPADTTPSQEPWIWLQDLEPSGAADDCVCHLEAAGPNGTPGAAFYMCSLHQQAQAMHTALRDTLYALERGSFGPSDASQAITAIRKVLTATQTAPPSRTITTRSKAAPAYLAALDELDHSLRVYIDVCPFCGTAPIYVISFTADCALPVNKDGWDTIDGTITTDNEAFACTSCHCSIDPAYVYGLVYRQ